MKKIILSISAMEDGQIYRLLLVFKKNNTITGVSKICLECKKEVITNQFGEIKHIDMDDFEKLAEILK